MERDGIDIIVAPSNTGARDGRHLSGSIRQEWNECVILYEKYEATIASEYSAGIGEVDGARNDTVDELMT
jgi:hypothetical protein